MSVRVFALRHGQTPTNGEGRIQGIADDPYWNDLTGVGRWQAFWAAQELNRLGAPIDAVVSSQLRRARQTAEHVALYLGGLSHAVCGALVERDFGALEGLHFSQAQEKLASFSSDAKLHTIDLSAFGGESTESMRLRAERVNEFLRAGYDGKTIVVISHGGFLRFWMMHNGLVPPEVWPNATFREFVV